MHTFHFIPSTFIDNLNTFQNPSLQNMRYGSNIATYAFLRLIKSNLHSLALTNLDYVGTMCRCLHFSKRNLYFSNEDPYKLGLLQN